MPIEIRELVIRATVDPAAGGDGASGTGNCGMPPDKDKAKGGTGGGDLVEAGGDLVQACVREVMRILERKAER
jgi:hypothetical protein